jgi:hypothetical protein
VFQKILKRRGNERSLAGAHMRASALQRPFAVTCGAGVYSIQDRSIDGILEACTAERRFLQRENGADSRGGYSD